MRLHYRIAVTLLPYLFKVIYRLHYYGRDLVPRTGGALLASNHVSLLDPPLLGIATPREIAYMAKKELFKNPLLGALIRSYNAIPVDRGRAGRELFSRLAKQMQGGRMLLMFPEGTRSKTGDLLTAQAGVGMMALMAHVPIVPAYIHGARTAKPRLFNKDTISISYGAPITLEELDQFPKNKKGYLALSAEIMVRITKLKEARECT